MKGNPWRDLSPYLLAVPTPSDDGLATVFPSWMNTTTDQQIAIFEDRRDAAEGVPEFRALPVITITLAEETSIDQCGAQTIEVNFD